MQKTPYFPALICLVGITGLSVMPNPQLPKFELLATDKFGHAVAYGLFSFFALRGFQKAGGLVSREWRVVLGVFAWGVLMEFVQYSLVPGRYYEIDDMVANGVGAAIGWGISKLFIRIFPN